MADQHVVRGAIEDFGDGCPPRLAARFRDADLAPDELVGQGGGVAHEAGTPGPIGEPLGLEDQYRIGG